MTWQFFQHSRINPIQIWILVCMSFVFATIMEYGLILSYERKTIRKIFVTRKKIQEQGERTAKKLDSIVLKQDHHRTTV